MPNASGELDPDYGKTKDFDGELKILKICMQK